MDNNTDLLLHAKQIGDQIIQSAIKDENGCYWNVKNYNNEIELTTSIYSGCSGTILYLIELYTATKEEKYLSTIIEGANWLMLYEYPENEKNLAFYCGLGGIVYILLEVNKINPNELYKNRALRIAWDCKGKPNNISDILYGTSGTILTLLYLHNETHEEWILDEIAVCINKLLNDVFITDYGICWDRGGGQIHSLCGFAHGASGVAFVLLELYRYFKIEFFSTLAEMAFQYENHFFSNSNESIYTKYNWADLRKDIYTQENIEKLILELKSKNNEEFVTPAFMSAWCHGAPGIGMARLHAFLTTGNKEHLHYHKLALENVRLVSKFGFRNYTLCHGALGNANLFIDSYLALRDSNILELAQNEAKNCINDMKNYGFHVSGVSKIGSAADCDLLNGLAGIGHYYLRLLYPEQVKSCLLPIIKINNEVNSANFDYSNLYFNAAFFNRLFPNTSLIYLPEDFLRIYPFNNFNKQEFILKIVELINTNNNYNVINCMELDLQIIHLFKEIKSDNYFFIKDIVDKSNFNEIEFDNIPFEKLQTKNYAINSTCNVLKQDYNKYSKYSVLQISPINEPVIQFTIGKYAYDLLTSFSQETSVRKSFNFIKENYFTSECNIAYFQLQYKTLLKNFIKTGLVVVI